MILILADLKLMARIILLAGDLKFPTFRPKPFHYSASFQSFIYHASGWSPLNGGIFCVAPLYLLIWTGFLTTLKPGPIVRSLGRTMTLVWCSKHIIKKLKKYIGIIFGNYKKSCEKSNGFISNKHFNYNKNVYFWISFFV